jgi:2,3-bisphosphoglycerate-independent phosphoglycerate mutase
VIFMNFRADRARELTRAFTAHDFQGFPRRVRPRLADFVTLTRYADDIAASVAYGTLDLPMVLGEYLEKLHLTQLRIAETEKYAHVTFFFSGGREEPFAGEERVLIPSPRVKTYDLKPEMSAPEVTDALVAAIRSRRFDAIVCNFANGDMVGHTGNMPAAIKAVETIDACLARIDAALREVGGEGLITADHGNVEMMSDAATGQAHTAHTSQPVPLVYLGPRRLRLRERASLCDVAPTLLHLMGLPKPREMTGESVIVAD